MAGIDESLRERIIDEVLRNRKKWVLWPAYSVLRNIQDAEDASQKTLLKVIGDGLDSYDPNRPLEGWIVTMATNQSRDILRRRLRRNQRAKMLSLDSEMEGGGTYAEVIKEDSTGILDKMIIEEDRASLNVAMGHVPEYLRKAMDVVYRFDFSYHDAAEILQVPVGTVKSRVYYGRRHLARYLELTNTKVLKPSFK